jgi:hypothetical protein
MGQGIRFAQRRNHEQDWEDNHICALDKCIDGEWTVVQAEPRGITNDKLLTEIAVGGTFKIIPLPASVDREKFLEYQRSKVGLSYGYLTLLSIAGNMFLPESVHFRWKASLVCSGLVATGLMFGGFSPTEKVADIYDITPAQVARMCYGDVKESA